MASTVPKPAATRQRRNRTTTAATLEAGPAQRVALPDFRVSSLMCEDCASPAWHHTKTYFQRAEREGWDATPHDYVPRVLPWRDATRRWWETIWDSPMAAEWVDADVPGLMALAVLVDDFWTAPDSKVHAEIRQASREFGLSPLSRRQLQWEIKRLTATPQRPAAPPVPSRRASLSVLSGGA